MPNTPGTGNLNDPFAPDLPREQRLRALESVDAEAESDQAYATRLQALAAEFAAHRILMRDQEKALVERIADVDDDRRLAIIHLQRAWQTQRDELAGKLRRPGWLAAAALMLVLALGGGLIALYFDVRASRATLTAAIERLTAEQQRLAAALAARGQSLHPVPLGTRTGPEPTGTEPATSIGIAVPTPSERPIGEATATEADPGEAPATTPDAPPPADPAPAPMVGAQSEDAAATATEADPTPFAIAAPTSAQDPEPEETFRVTDRPFALQLVGSHQRERLLELAANQALPQYVYLHQETRRGRPWFVLIHSLYSNIEDAQAALARLPPGLRKPLPWVRALPAETTLDRIATGSSAG
ncbi:SPOR domain-containing protein [uncultured Lamprocystis sp.]|jgi:DamX protein|uniref:SPOR domain-containing protein n=1 Tax=uncultured Lamprocystis sp. TaxID=543132 RepID=UPI0025D4BCEF|nr:SPOR domain-containing protein [uncultured Lamprocystis sp.]